MGPPTEGSSPPPDSSNFLSPLLALYIPFPVDLQCHLSNDILVSQDDLAPFIYHSMLWWSNYSHSSGRCVQPSSIFRWWHYRLCLSLWFGLMMVLRILSFSFRDSAGGRGEVSHCGIGLLLLSFSLFQSEKEKERGGHTVILAQYDVLI